MGHTKVTQTYANAEFTAASGDPNYRVFRRKLEDLALSVQPNDVHRSGTDVVLVWDDLLPLAVDLGLIDAAVLAHVGGPTSAAAIRIESEAEDTNATNTWELKLELETPKLVAGTYEIMWYAEIACDAVVDLSQAAVRVIIDNVVEFSGQTTETGWFPVSGNNFVDVLEGDRVKTEIRYRKSGTAANMAKIQKARISFRPLAA